MSTDYTIVGRTRNAENILKLVEGIESKGFSCYNFLHQPVLPEHKDKSWEEQMKIFETVEDFWNHEFYQHHFKKDMDGLNNATTTILLLPAGMAAHMEAGVAYGLGKKLVLIGEVEKPETLYLMFEERYPTIEAFLETI